MLHGTAVAETTTATIAVSVDVLPVCAVSSTAVAFGAYTPQTEASRQGSLTVNCTAGTAYAVALDEGQRGDGSTRRMARPDGATLAYDLYRDSAHQQRWGGGAAAATGTGSGATQSLALYAAIKPNVAPAGIYTDNVVVQITY